MISSISGLGGGMAALQGARSRPDPAEMFSKIDGDGNGSVDATELQTMADHMAEKMGDQAPSAEELMARMDTDGDGAMSFAEFEAGRPPGPPPGGPQGPPPGGGQGMMPPGLSFDASGDMDLSSLFNSSEEEDATAYESLYAYA